ncbi:hypothetical protein NL676_001699 [Syzygium grande]|nr:hypothetical protein NL676_001699 [Syzygium grande]
MPTPGLAPRRSQPCQSHTATPLDLDQIVIWSLVVVLSQALWSSVGSCEPRLVELSSGTHDRRAASGTGVGAG